MTIDPTIQESSYPMNDLRSALRQLLKNRSFTVHAPQCYGGRAAAALTLESGGRTPDDHRSTPKASRLPAAVPPRDSSVSHARTMLGGRSAGAPGADSGARVLLGTGGRPSGRPVECAAAVPGRVAKNSVCRAKSRMAVKLGLRCLRACRLTLPIFGLSLIQQRAQSGTWARIAEDALPRCITIQLRQQSRQTRYEFLAFLSGEALDSRLDFLHRAHGSKDTAPTGPRQVPHRAIPQTSLIANYWPLPAIANH